MQITAALLLIGNVGTKTNTIFKNVYNSSVMPYFEDGILKNTKPLRDGTITAYKNKVAFFLLMLGYLFSPLGSQIDEYRWYSVAVLTVLSGIAFIFITSMIDKKVEKKNFKNIDKSELDISQGDFIIDD